MAVYLKKFAKNAKYPMYCQKTKIKTLANLAIMVLMNDSY